MNTVPVAPRPGRVRHEDVSVPPIPVRVEDDAEHVLAELVEVLPEIVYDERVRVRIVESGGDVEVAIVVGHPGPVGLVVEEPVFVEAHFAVEFQAEPVAPIRLAAGDDLQVTLSASEGSAPVEWWVAEGTLPWGVALTSEGVLTGSPAEHGTFDATLQARDALGLQGTTQLRLEVSVPELSLEAMAADLLSDAETGALTAGQEAFLDRSGNGDGELDIGDIRVYQTTLRPLASRAPGAAVVLAIQVRLGGGS